jgi:hypothetical protein
MYVPFLDHRSRRVSKSFFAGVCSCLTPRSSPFKIQLNNCSYWNLPTSGLATSSPMEPPSTLQKRQTQPLMTGHISKLPSQDSKVWDRRCVTQTQRIPSKYISTTSPPFHHNLQPLSQEKDSTQTSLKCRPNLNRKLHPQLPCTPHNTIPNCYQPKTRPSPLPSIPPLPSSPPIQLYAVNSTATVSPASSAT